MVGGQFANYLIESQCGIAMPGRIAAGQLHETVSPYSELTAVSIFLLQSRSLPRVKSRTITTELTQWSGSIYRFIYVGTDLPQKGSFLCLVTVNMPLMDTNSEESWERQADIQPLVKILRLAKKALGLSRPPCFLRRNGLLSLCYNLVPSL